MDMEVVDKQYCGKFRKIRREKRKDALTEKWFYSIILTVYFIFLHREV